MLCGAHKSNVKQEWGAQDDLGNAHPPKCSITPTTNTLGPYETQLRMNSIQSLEGGHSLGLVDVCTQMALILLLAVPVEPVFPGKDRVPYFPLYQPPTLVVVVGGAVVPQTVPVPTSHAYSRHSGIMHFSV